MAQDYGINNKGSGFFDDDEELDLDKMLENASRGASVDDDKDYSDILFDGNTTQVADETPVTAGSSPAVPEWNANYSQAQTPAQEIEVESYIEETVDEIPENVWEVPEINDPAPAPIPTRDRVIDIPQSQPSPEPQPVVQQSPVQQPAPEAPRRQFDEISEKQPEPEVREQKRQVMIKSTEDEVADVRKIINILDTYRNLDSDEVRDIVSQFVGNEDAKDESTLVVSVLEASNTELYSTMIALQEAAVEKDRVERVFYILRLEDNLLVSLGELVDSINENKIGPAGDKIEFSKSVEEAINKLDGKVINYVTATQTVLAAATS